MRFPSEYYRIQAAISHHLPHLRPSQQQGLALWVLGAVLARSACQNAVIAALIGFGRWHGLRQRLREWLYDGEDRAAPCQTQIEVSLCFAPLLSWVLAWWRADRIAIAVDATLHKDRTAALVVSVLYRGSAIPVAWHIMPANQKGPWVQPLIGLLDALGPAVPEGTTVLVLTDRGLWSPMLWRKIRRMGWHPLMRVKINTTFQPARGVRMPAHCLVPSPGTAWVGAGTAFSPSRKQSGTLLVVWAEGQKEPWIVLTDLAPEVVGVSWYAMRAWIEAASGP